METDKKQIWTSRGLAVCAGASLALAFQKFNVAGLAWIAPGLMLFAARRGEAFRLGYLAGCVHYLISLSWLLQIPVRLYPIMGWLALAAYLALYPAVWTWVCARIVGARDKNWLARFGQALLCAAIWVALEMTISRLFSGFPWNLLGASQQQLLPLLQVASFSGVYGVAFVVVWFSVSLLHVANAALALPSARHLWLRELALPMFVVALLYAMGLHRISQAPSPVKTIRVALIQPSIPQTMIWNESETGSRFAELLRLSTAALAEKPQLMIWPEAAVPGLIRDDAAVRNAITSLARTHKTWIVIGADDFDLRGTNAIFYNSSFLVSPEGELAATYRKRRLVIFGEYVPLLDWLPFIKYLTPISGGFAAGDRPVTFDLPDLKVKTSVLICFEDTFPHYAREHATDDVDFLINITNDGWFGDSAAQWQHAANAAYRSVENRLPLVRCANNGISCWIDVNGAMHDVGFGTSGNVYRAGYKIVNVPIGVKERTFYTRHGDWFGWTCVLVALFPTIARVTQWRQEKER